MAFVGIDLTPILGLGEPATVAVAHIVGYRIHRFEFLDPTKWAVTVSLVGGDFVSSDPLPDRSVALAMYNKLARHLLRGS